MAYSDSISEPTYRCPICRDQGMEELIVGRHDVGHGHEKIIVEATNLRPVYRKCKGPHGSGCPYRKWSAEQAKAASTATVQGGDL